MKTDLKSKGAQYVERIFRSRRCYYRCNFGTDAQKEQSGICRDPNDQCGSAILFNGCYDRDSRTDRNRTTDSGGYCIKRMDHHFVEMLGDMFTGAICGRLLPRCRRKCIGRPRGICRKNGGHNYGVTDVSGNIGVVSPFYAVSRFLIVLFLLFLMLEIPVLQLD